MGNVYRKTTTTTAAVTDENELFTIFTVSPLSAYQGLPTRTEETDSKFSEENHSSLNQQYHPKGTAQFKTENELEDRLSITASATISTNDRVRFVVGEERKVVIGQKAKTAAMSEVFDAMFSGHWKICNDTVEVPDVCPEAFEALLRYASGDPDLKLTESTVWDVLKAADKYQVLPLVRRCFHFLLHKHSAREDGEHLCHVMELAHRLHQREYRQTSFTLAKARAADILSSKLCLQTLCYHCMLAIVRADDLAGVDETLVHEAVLAWTHCACAQRQRQRQEPSWEELRATAGELVRHVRYLVMPRRTLVRLREGPPSSCLLTDAEMTDLLKHGGSLFPPDVRYGRRARVGQKTNSKDSAESAWTKRNRLLLELLLYVAVFLLIVLALVFMLKKS